MNLLARFDEGSPAFLHLQGDADEEEVRRSFGLRRLMFVASGLLILLFLAAAFIPIGAAVIGNGQIGVESRVKRIAHPTGGVIAEIAVINGQHVKRGQLLMRLDDKVTGAGATYSSLTVEQVLAQRARLEAERLSAPAIAFPVELAQANTDSARMAMADEARLFSLRRTEEAQLRAQLNARIAQYSATIRGIEAQIASLETQRRLIEPERQGVRDLWDQKLVTINRLNQLERTAADLDGNIAAQQAQIAQARAHIAETREQLIQLGETRRAEAGTELARINIALNDQRLRSVAAKDQQARSEIRAPYSGTVEKIAFSAIGEVIRPAEPIMEIVPDEDAMVVETSVSPADIDQVRAGQRARIHFTSFNRATTPEFAGKVVYVAADRTENSEAHQSYFMVRVQIDQEVLRRERLSLRSGMPAEVYIETGSRSMLSYITKPLRDQFMRAFRDN